MDCGSRTQLMRKARRSRPYGAEPLGGGPCPSCGLTLLPGREPAHLKTELEKLNRFSEKLKKPLPSVETTCSRLHTSAIQAQRARYQNFIEIREQRELRRKANRVSAAQRKRHVSGGSSEADEDEATCPVCLHEVYGTPDVIATHVDRCVRQKRRQSGADDMTDSVDVEADDSSGSDCVESYVWAGQARLRASSWLPEGALPEPVLNTSTDQTLDVDGAGFGEAQYTEADLVLIVPDSPREEQEQRALRTALLDGMPSRDPTARVESEEYPRDTVEQEPLGTMAQGEPRELPYKNEMKATTSNAGSRDATDETKSRDEDTGHVTSHPDTSGRIESLDTLSDTRGEDDSNEPKCVVCMNSYNKPVTSVQCWHVLCELCWMHALGAKKLCPKCKVITTPEDLRRLFM